MGLIGEIFAECLKPIDRAPPWQWAERHVIVDKNSPYPGPWRLANSPLVKKLMEKFPDNGIKNLTVMTAAQSSKTLSVMILLMWAADNDPGPAMWVQAAKDEADTFVRTRLLPMFEDCEPVARLLLSHEKREKARHEVKLSEIGLKTMSVFVTGSNSPSKLKSKPIRWLFLDEVAEYPPGALDSVTKRVRSFWNSRRVMISTPKKAKDAMHIAFLEGCQDEWHFACPKCGELQPLVIAQLKAEHPDTSRACRWDEVPGAVTGGVWDFDTLAKAIRYECRACGHLMPDEPKVRQHIATVGDWIAQNPKAPRKNYSIHWSALLPPIVKWREIVEEKIIADRAVRLGDVEPLMEFINQTLGEPWEDRLKEFDDFSVLEERKGAFKLRAEWPEQTRRFLSGDVQGAGGFHIRYVCRAVGADNQESRLVDYGTVANFEEFEAKRMALGVEAKDTVIDSAHESAKVYKACLKYKWKAFRGDDVPFFNAVVEDPKTREKVTVRRVWALSHADPAIGTPMQGKVRPIKLYRWSNPAVKDILALAMTGAEQRWQIAEDATSEYYRQITAEKRVEEIDAKGRISYVWKRMRRDNHYFDCECMIMAAALITRSLGRVEDDAAPPPGADGDENEGA